MDISKLSDADLEAMAAGGGASQPIGSQLASMTDAQLEALASGGKPEQAPKQRSGFDTAMRGLGLGSRSVIEGVTALPGMVYDAGRAALNTPTAAYNLVADKKAAYPFPRSASDLVQRGEAAIGLPEPETKGERIQQDVQRNVASLLPTMGTGALMRGSTNPTVQEIARSLVEKFAAQIGGAAGAGGASGFTREAGGGPIAQTAAGLAGGVAGAGGVELAQAGGRALAAAAQPFTEAGRQRIAADVLLRGSSDPASLRQRIDDGMTDTTRRLPGSPVTTATAARDPGLMVMERGLASDVGTSTGQGGLSGSAALRDIEARRNASRLGAIQSMADDATPELRGAAVRNTLNEQQGQTRQAVSRMYNAVDPEGATAVPVYQIGRGMFDAAERRYGPGGGAMPSEAQSILDEIRTAADAGRSVDFRWMQNVRSRLGSAAGMAAQQGDRRAAETFGEMRQALDDAVNGSMARGQGFTPEQAATWQAATAARRDMGQRFGRDATGANATEQILKRDPFGAPIMPDASVADRALSSVGNVRQVIRAAGGEADTVRQNLRGQFVEKMLGATRTSGVMADAQGNVAPALSAGAFDRFLMGKGNRQIANEIFDGDQLTQLRQIAADFGETAMTNTMGKARGSDTAQNLSVGNFIARASNGLISPNDPGAQTVASIGGLLRLVYAAPEAATREIVVRAAVDPGFASMLLQRASPQNVQRAADYLNSTMAERLVEAARGATLRTGVRTTNEAAARQ